MVDLQKVGQGHRVNNEYHFCKKKTFDGKRQNLQMSPTHFCTSFYSFRYIKNVNICRPRPRSRSTIFAGTIRLQMEKYKCLTLLR